jgi:hypothetical protein
MSQGHPRDGTLSGAADPSRIDINAPAEMRHWVREIGRPVQELRHAVGVVGPLVMDVRAFLQRRTLYGLR